MKDLKISASEITFTFTRSSGPGGQNVNKVNSKAVLRWNLLLSQSISEDLRARLLLRLSAQLTQEGEIVITSDRFRDQLRNRADCIEKLTALITKASLVQKKRKKTKPTRSSIKKHQEGKRRHSEKKKNRKNYAI